MESDDDKAWLTTYYMLKAQGLLNADTDSHEPRFPASIIERWIGSRVCMKALSDYLKALISVKDFEKVRRIFFVKSYCESEDNQQ
jgi:hypothetical protein